MKHSLNNALVIGGVAVALIGAVWIARRGAAGVGADIGGAIVDGVGGVVSGAGNAIADAANDPEINPLQPLGSWLGTTIYDWTHPGSSDYLPPPKTGQIAEQNQASRSIIDAANDPEINPLQPLGAWIGGKLYDWTH